MTDKIYAIAQAITSYATSDVPAVDLASVGSHTFDHLTVEVVDPVEEYVQLMKELFDFAALKAYISSGKVAIHADCLSGTKRKAGRARCGDVGPFHRLGSSTPSTFGTAGTPLHNDPFLPPSNPPPAPTPPFFQAWRDRTPAASLWTSLARPPTP